MRQANWSRHTGSSLKVQYICLCCSSNRLIWLSTSGLWNLTTPIFSLEMYQLATPCLCLVAGQASDLVLHKRGCKRCLCPHAGCRRATEEFVLSSSSFICDPPREFFSTHLQVVVGTLPVIAGRLDPEHVPEVDADKVAVLCRDHSAKVGAHLKTCFFK